MSEMLSTSLAAVAIALAITIVAQLLCSAGILTTDARNLCLASLVVWVGITAAVFVFGVFAVLGAWFR